MIISKIIGPSIQQLIKLCKYFFYDVMTELGCLNIILKSNALYMHEKLTYQIFCYLIISEFFDFI